MAVKLKGPANHGGFGFRGESFVPDEDGQIDVPHEALDEAFSHGFSIAAEQPEAGTSSIPTSAEIQAANLAKLNKKQLVAFGKDNLGLELDESKTNKELIAEIEATLDAKAADLAATAETA